MVIEASCLENTKVRNKVTGWNTTMGFARDQQQRGMGKQKQNPPSC